MKGIPFFKESSYRAYLRATGIRKAGKDVFSLDFEFSWYDLNTETWNTEADQGLDDLGVMHEWAPNITCHGRFLNHKQ